MDVGREPSEATLGSCGRASTPRPAGRRFADVGAALAPLPEAFVAEERPLVTAILGAVEETLREQREERLVLAGTANLARSGTDFVRSIGPVLEAIEEAGRPAQAPQRAGGGRERRRRPDRARDRSGRAERGRGDRERLRRPRRGRGPARRLGPTRMDYPTTMAAVRAVARYVSRILAS